MANGALLTMLHNTMQGLLRISDMAMPDGVASHVGGIHQKGKAPKVIRSIKPSRIEDPKVNAKTRMVAEVERVFGDPEDDRAPTIVLQ